jgi:hypothetical protein
MKRLLPCWMSFVFLALLAFPVTAHEGHGSPRQPLQGGQQVRQIAVTIAAPGDQPVVTTASAAAPQVAAPQAPGLQTAKGVVFEDRDGNGRRDDGETGLPGIRVSNGKDIVTTDALGAYSLAVDEDEIIFVIKPRDFMTPVGPDQLPKFYYIHKPAGSPPHFQFAGVAPTGPLPASIDFPLNRRPEPDRFRALIFGDTQPRNVAEVEYMSHDVIEEVIANQAHGASLGVTLGDIVFDDLDVMTPHNRAIALIGIPWYNVIGNHDMNFDAEDDRHSDETFERIYGPAYYSFDHGPTHFLVLDDVTWVGAKGDEKAHYVGGLGERQMEFIRNDLAMIPDDQLVVLMMHIPLTDVQDRKELYRLIEQRPATVSLSAHTHYMEHRFIGEEDGWQGPEKHHHIINVTVCGSWWRGRKDERGIPHATMSDGGPNGYSVMEFDGSSYSLEFHAAGRPADYQMNVYAPEVVKRTGEASAVVMANVFAGSEKTIVEMRVADDSNAAWQPMERITAEDPAFLAEVARETSAGTIDWTALPKPHATPHLWRCQLPQISNSGTHVIEVRATDASGKSVIGRRAIRVE